MTSNLGLREYYIYILKTIVNIVQPHIQSGTAFSAQIDSQRDNLLIEHVFRQANCAQWKSID